MLKAYYYSAAEAGLPGDYPPGLLRLAEGDGLSERVTDPAQADIFILPTIMRNIGPERFSRLPYLAGNERRTMAWNLADDMAIEYPCGPLYLRAESTRALQLKCETVQGWPWPVEDLWPAGLRQADDTAPFTYDVCFQGWASSDLTNAVCESVQRQAGLRSHIQLHKFFYGYHDTDPAYAHYRQSFIETLRASRLSLVPRSIPAGVIRYRFYEALSAGRVPVHFCDGRVLPWATKIDYAECSLHIDEKRAAEAGEIIAWWLVRHDDNDIRRMGRYGRIAWQRWLNRDKWPALFLVAAQEYLARG